MNKRITSLLLCFVMVFVMLATAVPALAAPIESTQLKVIPDKTKASPGDIITYTIVMGPVSDMGSMQMVLDIPTGLTYVENSTTLAANLKTTLGFDLLDWTEVSKMINGGASAADYESATDTELAKFQCKVDDGATGSLEVGLTNLEFGSCQTFEYHTDRFSVVKTPVTITAAPKPATGISLNKTAATIYTGNTETLIATVEPTDTTDTVVWTSSKESVATVDNTGKVTAVAPGTATITATITAKAGDKTATCTVTVENAPCTHTDKTNVDAKPSTCTEQGWEAYSKCNDCGQLFDKDGNEISAIPYLSLAAHSLTPVAAKAATCTVNGNKAYYKCDVCGKWFEDATANVEIANHSSVVLTALGHDYTERIEDAAHKKATATDCRSHDTYWYDCTRGDHNAKDDPAASDKWYESTNAGSHSYDESAWGYKGADGHAHKCRYDDTHDTPVAHTPGAAATETTPQTCTECGYIITPALGHTHSMTKVDANPASCTEKGNIEYYKCDGCGKLFADATGNVELTADQVVVAATGHDYEWKIDKEATATEKGSKHEECKNCGDKKAAVEIPATGTPTTPTEPNKPADTKSPQTGEGDNSNMILWIALLFVSGGVLAGTTLYSRKRKSVK